LQKKIVFLFVNPFFQQLRDADTAIPGHGLFVQPIVPVLFCAQIGTLLGETSFAHMYKKELFKNVNTKLCVKPFIYFKFKLLSVVAKIPSNMVDAECQL
jgi:hypothetical protein